MRFGPVDQDTLAMRLRSGSRARWYGARPSRSSLSNWAALAAGPMSSTATISRSWPIGWSRLRGERLVYAAMCDMKGDRAVRLVIRSGGRGRDG